MTFLRFTLPGDPIPKGRPRMGKNGHAFTPERTVFAEREITAEVIGIMDGSEPIAGPVGIRLAFACATKRRTDLDNLVKLVTDAMNGVVYEDDRQIEAIEARLVRGVGKAKAHTAVEVYLLGEDQVIS